MQLVFKSEEDLKNKINNDSYVKNFEVKRVGFLPEIGFKAEQNSTEQNDVS